MRQRRRTRKEAAPESLKPGSPTQPASEEPVAKRGRSRRAEAAKVQPELEPPAVPEPKPGRGRRGRRETPAQAQSRATEFRVDDLGDDIPIPAWRPHVKSTAPSSASPEEQLEQPSRNKRRRGREKAIEITAQGAVEVEIPEPTPQEEPQQPKPRERRRHEKPAAEPKPAPAVAEPPKPPSKPVIATPADAPQVVIREGLPTLVREGRVYPPMLFFGSSTDERRAQTVLDELKMAGEAGIHLHSHLVEFEVDPEAVDSSVAIAAYMLKKSVELDSESQVIFRIVFQAPRNWQQRFPNAKFNMQGGGIAEPSVCDDEFWGVAKSCLESFVRKLRMLDLKDHILGVHIERGEWFL
ncbi:MAG TPA: hypothetical protein VMI31_05955, partial [Fimbriimonadaceae bacterium]|nr:hypothetical protein [Fimbriimonadaceae bacterium]